MKQRPRTAARYLAVATLALVGSGLWLEASFFRALEAVPPPRQAPIQSDTFADWDVQLSRQQRRLLLLRSSGYRGLADPERAAFERLAFARVLMAYGSSDLEGLAKRRNARVLFEEMYEVGNPIGRVYACCALLVRHEAEAVDCSKLEAREGIVPYDWPHREIEDVLERPISERYVIPEQRACIEMPTSWSRLELTTSDYCMHMFGQ